MEMLNMSEGRSLTVNVHKDEKNEELQAEIKRLSEALAEKDSILNQLAETTFREEVSKLAEQYPNHRQKIMNVETPSQYEFIRAFFKWRKTQQKV